MDLSGSVCTVRKRSAPNALLRYHGLLSVSSARSRQTRIRKRATRRSTTCSSTLLKLLDFLMGCSNGLHPFCFSAPVSTSPLYNSKQPCSPPYVTRGQRVAPFTGNQEFYCEAALRPHDCSCCLKPPGTGHNL